MNAESWPTLEKQQKTFTVFAQSRGIELSQITSPPTYTDKNRIFWIFLNRKYIPAYHMQTRW